MTEAKLTWSIWQALLNAFAWAFTRRGFHHFAEWITGHGSQRRGTHHHPVGPGPGLTAPRPGRPWRSFAEHGAWQPRAASISSLDSPDRRRPRVGSGTATRSRPVDDTKVHRSSPDVWGTCTFHEYTARCPNRAPTVRAHNWVVLGALLHERREARPGFCPISARLYFRKSQLPVGPDGILEPSRPNANWPSSCSASKPASSRASTWPFSTGATPSESVVRPLVLPAGGAADRVPRPACGATLGCAPCPCPRSNAQGEAGQTAQVGSHGWRRPARAACWPGKWQDGTAFIYGRQRHNPLEGDHLPVAGPGLGGAGQGDCRLRRGIQGAVHTW